MPNPPNDPEHAYTWDFVLALVPAPTPEAVARYTLKTPTAELVELGATIRTEKVLTDLVRWSGQVAEFLPKVTPAQRRLLLGFSDSFFRVLVHEGKKLREMLESKSGNKDAREAKRVAVLGAAAKSYSDGMDERERLTNALEGVAEHDTGKLRERIDQAEGTVESAEDLVRSLKALAALARALLADPTTQVAQQLVDGGVTNEELDAFEATAEEVKSTAAAAAGARAQGAVTQAELDEQDAVCLTHMGRLMRIFRTAHSKDPSVPHLVPNSSRRVLAPSRKRPATPTEPKPK